MTDFNTCSEAIEKIRSHLVSLKADYAAGVTPSEARAADYALVQAGLMTEGALVALYSSAFGKTLPDENELEQPEPYPESSSEFAAANLFLPYEWNDDTVTFRGLAVLLEQLVLMVRSNWNLETDFMFVRPSFLERMINRQQNAETEEESRLSGEPEDENTLRSMAGEAKIVRLVNDIFARAIESGASDIHIEPGEELVSVRCRIDGVLREIMTCPLKDFPAIASRVKLIGGLNIAESRLPQDGRTNVKLGRLELDMRISTIPILTGESIVLRLLNQSALSFDLGVLGMSERHLEQFKRLIEIPHGMILVVGPTGSGKTTTLYSVMTRLNDSRRKIITIEDPVEYKMEGLCQMQVNPKIGVTFAAGLRHIVRQDPDIILVGEIRDRETADIAINAALTGHLVLSTLHTNDAVGALTRLLDMGVEPFLVSSALYGVLSQRLVRKICPECGGSKVSCGVSCRKCGGTGFKGRCGIFELLTVNDELRNALNRAADSSELESIAVRNGMISLAEDGDEKVNQGVTTRDEVTRAAASLT